jgi:hypothetical protein
MSSRLSPLQKPVSGPWTRHIRYRGSCMWPLFRGNRQNTIASFSSLAQTQKSSLPFPPATGHPELSIQHTPCVFLGSLRKNDILAFLGAFLSPYFCCFICKCFRLSISLLQPRQQGWHSFEEIAFLHLVKCQADYIM